MLQLDNHTPFGAALFPFTDAAGQESLIVSVKAKFAIAPVQQSVSIADKQENPLASDIYWGDPAQSSVRYEADTAPQKNAIDLAVLGHAYAQGDGPVSAIQVSVTAGALTKRLQVFGDRFWEKSSVGWAASQVQPFEKMPIVYERAFGGVDHKSAQQNPAFPIFFEPNPVGKGFTVQEHHAPEPGLPLPNVESVGQLIERWQDQPSPAGFGFIHRAWQPRRTLAGTYDEHWQHTRMPLLPSDFDMAYFSAAAPGMRLPIDFSKNAWFELQNMTPNGPLCFGLPPMHFAVSVTLRNRSAVFSLVLDTIVIEPDALMASVTWRVAIPCTRKLLYIKNVSLKWGRSS